MNTQEKSKNKSNYVPTSIIIASLIACILCVTLLAIGTLSDGYLHQIMSVWFGPYIIISASFLVTFFVTKLLGFNMRIENGNVK